MKNILKEYVKIFGYAITGIVFVFASFYLIINVYHMEELSQKANIDIKNNEKYKSIEEKIENINKNLDVSLNNSKKQVDKKFLSVLKSKLNYCSNRLNNSEFQNLKNKKIFGVKDAYNLRNSLSNNVINGCLIEQLHYLTYYSDKDGNSDGLTEKSQLIKLNIDTISKSLDYFDKDLLNNSSYFYTTPSTKASVMNKPKAMYDLLMNTYEEAASLVEYLAEWVHEEAGGVQ